MKKKLIFILSTFLLLSLFLVNFTNVQAYDASKDTVSVAGATYKATKNVLVQDLGYGITHTKDLGVSSATRLNDYDSCGPKNTLVGQQVNILTVPSNETVRIVNWTYMNSNGCTLQTVRKLAENFELYNPGWKVIAGVNGDFFDINANGALPYQGNGYTVSNGEVYRPYGSSSNIGFKNDGSSTPFVGGKAIEVSNLKLQFLNEKGQIVSEYDVAKQNKAPVDNEIAVWFTYNVMNTTINEDESKTTTRDTITITAPSTDCYVCLSPVRCLAMSETTIYGKGTVQKNTTDTDLRLGHFAIQTSNTDVQKYLESDLTVRVQQNIVGDYAECDNISGAGAQLLLNSQVVLTEGNEDRHPRTVAGVKADGTIILMTVDGRQFESNMYGMSYAELSATLLYYDCVEAYNLDGGGSTTFITRNQYGEFDVYNSPSDGSERGDSNAILVVVPDITINASEITDSSITLNYQTSDLTTISNATLTIGNDTKELTGESLTFNNLSSEKQYVAKYTYDVTYKNTTLKNQTGEFYFKTGKILPTLNKCFYEETDTHYIVHFNFSDPRNTLVYFSIGYDKEIEKVNEPNKGYIKIIKSWVSDPTTFKFNLTYNINSSIGENEEQVVYVKKLENYHINYNLDGGTNNDNNISSYNGLSDAFTLLDPTKEGYTFEGWVDENNHKITVINGDEFKDLNLTATWSKDKKGCGCNASTYIVNILSLITIISVTLIISRKKH